MAPKAEGKGRSSEEAVAGPQRLRPEMLVANTYSTLSQRPPRLWAPLSPWHDPCFQSLVAVS